MNFFRRLEAPPNPLHEAYTAATGHNVEYAVSNFPVATAEQLVPVDLTPYQPLFAAMAFHAENPGAPDHAVPGFPAPANPRHDEETP